jgi:hypothetical protein
MTGELGHPVQLSNEFSTGRNFFHSSLVNSFSSESSGRVETLYVSSISNSVLKE